MLSKDQSFRSGAIFASLGIVLGAFGAHILKEQLTSQMLTNFETGVRYQMYAALGLMLLGLPTTPNTNAAVSTRQLAPLLLIIGLVIFSGSLYIMALTGMRWLGAITPIGGVLLIGGFIWAAVEHNNILKA